MDEKALRLHGLFRAELERAKTLMRWARCIQVLLLLAAIATIFIRQAELLYANTAIALFASIAFLATTDRANRSRAVAQRASRTVLLAHALGRPVVGKEYAELHAGFSVSDDAGRDHEAPDYFSTQEPPGFRRLGHMLQELAFWTQHLAAISSQRLWIFFLASALVSLTALLATPYLASQSSAEAVARVVCVVLAFLTSGNVLSGALAFQRAEKLLAQMDERLERALQSAEPDYDVLVARADYSAVVQGIPLIPTNVYQGNRDRLNKLWASRQPDSAAPKTVSL